LALYRDVLPNCHAEGASQQACDPGQDDDPRRGIGPGHAHHQREVGDEPIVSAEHHRTQDAVGAGFVRRRRVRQAVDFDTVHAGMMAVATAMGIWRKVVVPSWKQRMNLPDDGVLGRRRARNDVRGNR
jgi:hypothetical protein